ncbi:MAG: MFS transporter [Deltaproteobacteria bacterium]|nr:MFS transporter [Deltaproteobacteria bacterium]
MSSLRATFRSQFGDLRGRALLVVLGALMCQMGLGFAYVLSPLAGDIIDEFGWSRTMYSSARAPQLFVIAAMSPVVGALAVRFGALAVLAAGAASLAFVFLLFGVMQNLWQMYALVMLLGVSITALGDIAVGQLVMRWVDRGRGLTLGLVYTGSNLGGWLIVPFAVGIASRSSWREACAALGAVALFVILPAALLLIREPAAGHHPASSESPHAPPIPIGSDLDLDLAAALRTRSFWILAGALFSFFFFFLGVLDFLVLFLTDSGLTKQEASRYFGHGLGIGIAAKLTLGLIADRVPHKSVLLLDYGLLALSSVLLIALPDAAPIWGFVICFFFATAARDVVYPLIISSCFGPRYLAKIYGSLMLTLAPGGALGPVFAAMMYDRFGNYRVAFYAFALLNLISLAALCLVRDERAQLGPSAHG